MLKQQFAVAKTGLLQLLTEKTLRLLFSAFQFPIARKGLLLSKRNPTNPKGPGIQPLFLLYFGKPFGVVMDELLHCKMTIWLITGKQTLIQIFSPYNLRRRVKSYFFERKLTELKQLLTIYPAISLWKRCKSYFLYRNVGSNPTLGLTAWIAKLEWHFSCKYTPQF